MGQKFVAKEAHLFDNGAIGWSPGGPFDCLGPYAKVQACPVLGTDKRYTVYATGYADTFFSVPACTQIRGKYVGGFITFIGAEDSPVFIPYDRFKHLVIPTTV